jgi:hypothetical protein
VHFSSLVVNLFRLHGSIFDDYLILPGCHTNYKRRQLPKLWGIQYLWLILVSLIKELLMNMGSDGGCFLPVQLALLMMRRAPH